MTNGTPNENTTLLENDKKNVWDRQYNVPVNSQMAKAGRSASLGYLGGSASLGTFQIVDDDVGPKKGLGLPKSYSISADGSGTSYLTPTQMGRSELYQQIPFTAVFGLQKKERNISQAFANYAAELDVMGNAGLSDTEKNKRKAQASMIIMDELEFDSNLITTPLVFAIIVAAVSQFLVGYSTGVMNAPAAVVFPGHSSSSWSLAVASFAVGGPFGANVGGDMADTRGRRGALLLNTWIFLIGGLLQTFAWNMATMIVARFIIGFASGFSSVLVPIYLGELAPPTLRGMLGTLTQFALVIGIFISNLLSFPFATEDNWRFLFSVTPITCTLQLLCAPFLLESPRWLLNKDPKSLRARYIIKQLRGLRHDHEVETEVGHYVLGGAVQRSNSEATLVDMANLTSNPKNESAKKVSTLTVLKEMMEHRKIRIMLLSCIILQMAQQLSGINAVFYYSTSFFEGVIDNPLVGTTILGGVNVVAVYVALLLMDSHGRKTLILWSGGGMFVSCIVIVLALQGSIDHMYSLVAMTAYVIFFEIGLGPIPFLIVAEMFEAKYVAVAMSVCSQVNWSCNFIVGLGFPYLNSALQQYSFVPFAVIILASFIFTIFVLPETQGTTPDELIAEMTSKNSASFVYQANTNDEANISAIDNEWRKAMEQLREEEVNAMNSGTYDYGFQPINEK